jgi:hypothetical protein
LPKSDRMRPIFTGSTNVPYAKINLELIRVKRDGRYTVVVDNMTANKNGFWLFRTPEYIKRGRYILYVTATDPDDENNIAQSSLRFNAVRVSAKKNTLTMCWSKLNNKKITKHTKKKTSSGISLDIGNSNNIHSGDSLNINISGNVQNSLVRVADSNGQIVYQDDLPGGSVGKVQLPETLPAGEYTVTAENKVGDLLMIAEETFYLAEAPVVNFGGNITLSLNEILSSLSSIAIFISIILLLFLSALFLEYWMSKSRLFEIDERSLKKKGLIS